MFIRIVTALEQLRKIEKKKNEFIKFSNSVFSTFNSAKKCFSCKKLKIN